MFKIKKRKKKNKIKIENYKDEEEIIKANDKPYNNRKKKKTFIKIDNKKKNNKKNIIYILVDIFLLIIVLFELITIFKLITNYMSKEVVDDQPIVDVPSITGKNNDNININEYKPKKKFVKLSRQEAVNNWKKYVDTCKNDSLIKAESLKEYKNPIVTGIIPVYNSQDTIKLAVRSIQYQDMKNIEIILVNDCADNKTTKIIEELQKGDPRIKIIKNEKKMGILYSRCIGILVAKGKYMSPEIASSVSCSVSLSPV